MTEDDNWRRYSHGELHHLLGDQFLSAAYRTGDGENFQALFCPYYVPLEGKLGADWGVIVNPLSTRFGMVTFEHDDCLCPDDPGPGHMSRHPDAPNQEGDMWDEQWTHVHDEGCDGDCPWEVES